MRVVQNMQMEMGEVDVSQIKLDPKSRDDIPQILRGLQHLYVNEQLRAEIFELLGTEVAPKVDKRNGRPGMTLWRIFVCGVLRLDLNLDYDRLQELVNQHGTIREMLGHGAFNDEPYQLQTLKDNVRLLTPELLDKVNQVVVKAGHALVKKKDAQALRGRCDSFVVETNVHYPSDINLLFDAMRKVVTLTARLCETRGLSDWRQHAYNLRHLKRQLRAAQNAKRGSAQSQEQKAQRQALIEQAHQDYLDVAQNYLDKARATLATLEQQGWSTPVDIVLKLEIEDYMRHATRQIDQTERRVIEGQAIAHDEKVFSVFEPHTEWISKGKAGVPVELGLKTVIMEDQFQFILHHRVMQRETDERVAVPMVVQTRQRYPQFVACSFDKGFHSSENQAELKQHLELVALPRKGKLSQVAKEVERHPEFVKARRKHSAVESAINALEVHGLDRCPDHGLDGFKRYVALAIVARNIHRVGAILKQQEQKREQRKQKYSDRDTTYKLAA